MSKKNDAGKPVKDEEPKVFGNPEYDAKDDIYSHAKEVPFKEKGDTDSSELSTAEDQDLDVPGAELDDANEAIGEEDEENNFYSLGGDNHNDLEEAEDGE